MKKKNARLSVLVVLVSLVAIAQAKANMTPIYRFWSDQNQSHFYTMSATEKDNIITTYPTNVWNYEGIAYYGFASDSGAVTADDLADGAVTSSKISDGTVSGDDLADSSVNSSKIADGTVVNADISNLAAITPSKIDTVNNNLGVGTASADEKLTVEGGNIFHRADDNPVLADSLNTGGQYAYDVFVVGKYAYVADGDKVSIVDISNPNDTFEVVSNVASENAYGIFVSGGYAYVASQGNGLQIYDFRDPIEPVAGGSINTDGSAYGVYVSGKYAYVADGVNGLVIIDVTSPTSSTIVNTVPTTDADDVFVSGNYAYVADRAGGLRVIDITDPTSASVVDTIATSASATGIYVSGRLAFVATADSSDGHPDSGVDIVDISDPQNISLVSNLAGTDGTPYDVAVRGKYMYVADGSGGMVVFDITTPTSPAEVGSYESPNAFSVYVSGKYAYLADANTGLIVVDINGLETPAITTGSLSTGNMDVSENASIDNDLWVGNGLVVGNGGINSQGPVSVNSAGGLKVGSLGYFQAGKYGLSAPASADCDSDAEIGRIYIERTGHRLYVCNGQSRGWDYITLTD